jgi:hypothetical protein
MALALCASGDLFPKAAVNTAARSGCPSSRATSSGRSPTPDKLPVSFGASEGRHYSLRRGEDYVYLVPFVEDEHTVFLKTIIPSRKATKQYIGEESNHED